MIFFKKISCCIFLNFFLVNRYLVYGLYDTRTVRLFARVRAGRARISGPSTPDGHTLEAWIIIS